MTAPWVADERPIIAACLQSYPGEGIFLAADGWAFNRFERNGEMAAIPYLRMNGPNGTVIEAPLGQFGWVEYGQ